MNLTLVCTQIYWLAIYALVLYGINELSTNSKKGSWLIAAFPFFIYPLLVGTTFNGWFNMAKFFTLVFALLYATIVRFGFKRNWALILLALLLHLNILQAVLRDFNSGNYLNVASGIVVLSLLYWPSMLELTAPEGEKPAQLIYPTSWAAIIAYCSWHMCFMYGYKSGRGIQGDYILINIVLLAIPCLVAYYRNSNLFFQSRLYTLSFMVLLVEATITRNREIWPLTPTIYTPLGYHIVSVLAFLIICLCAGYMIIKKPKELAATPLGLLIKTR